MNKKIKRLTLSIIPSFIFVFMFVIFGVLALLQSINRENSEFIQDINTQQDSQKITTAVYGITISSIGAFILLTFLFYFLFSLLSPKINLP